MNDEFLEEFLLSEAEEFVFPTFDGKKIQGWIYKPPVFDPTKRYPMLLYVHGGPHAMRGTSFNWAFQIISSNEYVLAIINPRGSSGYGQEFSDGCVKDWGGGDYRDYMMGLDYLLHTREYIDPERLGVYGGSYGGFMTNWIITHTDRFKAAVSMASLSNLLSAYGT
ncbi:MAG: prolyl oligopeptidase family serine peptidase, partial [Candidatus Aenigmarchaeota archaeon]|nr:prolyl oligopeptidase family serine peptidase [Candidatus Aenigmarchaeota archaeon]